MQVPLFLGWPDVTDLRGCHPHTVEQLWLWCATQRPALSLLWHGTCCFRDVKCCLAPWACCSSVSSLNSSLKLILFYFPSKGGLVSHDVREQTSCVRILMLTYRLRSTSWSSGALTRYFSRCEIHLCVWALTHFMLADTERFPSHTSWVYAAWLHITCSRSSSSCHRTLVLCQQYQLLGILFQHPFGEARICLRWLFCNGTKRKMQKAESRDKGNKNVICAGQIDPVLPVARWLTPCSKVCPRQ